MFADAGSNLIDCSLHLCSDKKSFKFKSPNTFKKFQKPLNENLKHPETTYLQPLKHQRNLQKPLKHNLSATKHIKTPVGPPLQALGAGRMTSLRNWLPWPRKASQCASAERRDPATGAKESKKLKISRVSLVFFLGFGFSRV